MYNVAMIVTSLFCVHHLFVSQEAHVQTSILVHFIAVMLYIQNVPGSESNANQGRAASESKAAQVDV